MSFRLQADDGSEFVYTYNAPKIPEQIIKLKIIKKEQGKDILIEGAAFEMAYPDGSKKTFQTDAKGVCEIKGLMFGKHTIRENSSTGRLCGKSGKSNIYSQTGRNNRIGSEYGNGGFD